MRNVSVVGIGNILMGDDGVGIHSVEKLKQVTLPKGVEVFNAGSDAFYALEAMEGRNKAIIMDACRGNNAPGTLYRFTFQQLRECKQAMRLSMHDLNFIDIIIGTKEAYKLPHEIVFIGVEPEVIDWSTELSPRVRVALPMLIELVLKEL